MADAFLAEGAKVVVNGRDEAKGQQCLDEMGAGDDAAFFAGDATKQDAVEGLIDFTIEQLRPARHLLSQLGRRADDRAGVRR